MKKIAFILCFLCWSSGLWAQYSSKELRVTEIQLSHKMHQVEVSFTLDVGKKATHSHYNLVIYPVLMSESEPTQKLELAPMVVQGRRANSSEIRSELAQKYPTLAQRPYYTANGGRVEYRSTLPYAEWMVGSRLLLRGVSIGCCSSEEVQIGTIAENLLYTEPVTEIEVIEVPVVTLVEPTGDQLAREFPFLASIDAWNRSPQKSPTDGLDYRMPLRSVTGSVAPTGGENEYGSSREGSLSIYFRKASREIDRNFSENNTALVELISVIRMIESSANSQISRVVIVGFASPEGSLEANNRLAWDRAVAVKSFLTHNSTLRNNRIDLYNGSIDWEGLREMVSESDLYDKFRIMEIIDRTLPHDPDQNLRCMNELMRLDGGKAYRYLYEHYFPKLRQAALIKVYYENIR